MVVVVAVVVEEEGVLSSVHPTCGVSPSGATSGRLGLFLGVLPNLPLECFLPAGFALLAKASEGVGSGGGGGGACGSHTPGWDVVVTVVEVYSFWGSTTWLQRDSSW